MSESLAEHVGAVVFLLALGALAYSVCWLIEMGSYLPLQYGP